MIASHNSFTYLSPKKWILNIFSFLWRCQDKTLNEQYKQGVRFFDVRIKPLKKACIVVWEVCHGKATLKKMFLTIKSLCEYFQNSFPDASIRIILEKKDNYVDSFKNEILKAVQQFPNILKYAAIKEGWEVIYQSEHMPNTVDCTYVPFHSDKSFWYNIKHLKIDTIKHYAKKHNPTITKELIEDKNTLYFMDFV